MGVRHRLTYRLRARPDIVHPGQGGLSVSPGHPMNLPRIAVRPIFMVWAEIRFGALETCSLVRTLFIGLTRFKLLMALWNQRDP